MKKILSFFLSFLMVISLCAVGFTASAAAENKMKIAVASDLHYVEPREELEHTIDDGIFWYANRRAAMEDESGFIIDEFLNQCAESEVEYILIPGDMTDGGKVLEEQHIAVAEKFRAFENRTGKQIFVIDGNHDIANGEEYTNINKFKSLYADFGYNQALTTTDYDCSYTADLGEGYRLIALDSCDVNKSTEDGITSEKINWVLEQSESAKADGKNVILMMHHNLLDHMPAQRIISRNFIIRNHYTTAEKFANSGIKVVFTGHEHCSDVTSYTSMLGNKIYDFATTALTMYPLQYRVFTLSDNLIKYEAKTINYIDFEDLKDTCYDFTDEQINLMKKGLNSYAKQFLKAGVKYRLQLQLTMEKMGIDESEFYYDVIEQAVSGLNDLLELPLYGENSLQSVADEYNIELPQSIYSSGWDVATEIVAAHYAGEEAFDLDSPEITILLRTVAIVLRDIPTDLLTDSLIEKIGKLFFVDGFNLKAIVKTDGIADEEYYAKALLSPFLYEFAYDDDKVNDNQGEIEGFKQNNNFKNVIFKIFHFINTLARYLNNILSILKSMN